MPWQACFRLEESEMEAVLDKVTKPRVQCAHHWLVEPVNGPTSEARCKHCNETRVFFNHVEDIQAEALAQAS
jgi:hypothetical protein